MRHALARVEDRGVGLASLRHHRRASAQRDSDDERDQRSSTEHG
ncbi:MAG: hypothetical protein JWO86_8511, partial [Myxococcaceae bacterium]|nr:hypothetical protein [Myxococcaceae bacterium]